MLPQTPQGDSSNAVVDFLCASSDLSGASILDTAGDLGDLADSLVPVSSLGATATGRTPWPGALGYLNAEGGRALSIVGRLGLAASGVGVLFDLASGDVRSAVFTGIDAFAYTGLGALAATGVTTAGSTTATALAVAGTYYASGGSEGILSSLCGMRSQ